jgi:hypothetical protein
MSMKFKKFPLSDLNNYKKQPPREPLYTLPEIADRLGVEYDTLRSYIKGKRPIGCPPPPDSAMLTGAGSASRMRTYLYKLSEYKAWWKLRQEFANKEKP